jgi:hypothetical protein
MGLARSAEGDLMPNHRTTLAGGVTALVVLVSGACSNDASLQMPQEEERTAIAREALCSGGSLTVTPTSGAPGSSAVLQAGASCQMANPEYAFFYTTDAVNSPWTQATPFTTSSSYNWQAPANASNGTVYTWQMWAREAGSTSAVETYSGATFTVGTPSSCTGVSANVSPSYTIEAGGQVQLFFGADTCDNPQYEVLYAPPGGSWSVLSPYGSSSTYTWDTTGAAQGNYSFQIWARQAGSTAAYETWQALELTLGGPCTSVTESITPSTTYVGGQVKLSGSATCGAPPEYKYLMLPPGGSWTVLSDWSSYAPYTWNTTGLTTGTYQIEIWARSAGSTALYEAWAGGTVTLGTSTPCTPGSGWLSSSPSSPAEQGTPVTFTASATGCPQPTYSYYMQPPSGPWALVQDWSTSPTYSWNTTGLAPGPYNFQAWIRAAGSTAANEAVGTTSFTVHSPNSMSFSVAHTYFGGNGDQYAATGDFNGDGKLDIAVAAYTDNAADVLLGNGDGSFQAATAYGVGSGPWGIAVGDFNGDGRLDVVTANRTANSVSVLLGKGDGTFQAAVGYGVGSGPFWVAVADFNGDGKPDLVTANGSSNDVSVLLGKGDGTFQAAVRYGAGPSPGTLVTGDFNGDGRTDLAVANNGSNTVSVLLGKGDGTFQAAVNYGVTNAPWAIATGDFNGDGKVDLVVADQGGVSVLLGNGDGTFQAALGSTATYSLGIAVGDFNGDGKADLVMADGSGFITALVLPGNGDGTFQAPLYYGNHSAVGVALGDFNGDGRTDVVVSGSGVSILLNTATY